MLRLPLAGRISMLMAVALWLLPAQPVNGWGFYGHRLINRQAVFLLPPDMLVLYKPQIEWLAEHAVDADKRRYAVPGEASRHYIDLDRYGNYPYDSLPRRWQQAIERFGEDSLLAHGIVPWAVVQTLRNLTEAFRAKDTRRILKLSADLGHYIADAHVPLHACSNYNGQQTGQAGIHALWESRIPELFAAAEWDFWLGRARYLERSADFIWERVLESAAAADTVLRVEALLNARFPPDRKYAFEARNGLIIRQYSSDYSRAYQRLLNGMVERRMRQSVYAVACFWYTAWVDAGQPDLQQLDMAAETDEERAGREELNRLWRAGKPLGKVCD